MDDNTNTPLGDRFAPDAILIDTSLDAVSLKKLDIHNDIAKEFSEIFPQVDQAKVIETAVPSPSNNVLLHKNFMQYLTLAWSNHFSVVISPDIIFYTVLCEIADEITTNPDAFRHLFTNSTEKKPIITLTHDVTNIDLNQILTGIAQNIPVDASIFTADFSCSTVESRLAMQSAFCEAMSAYYYYMSTCCGIPRVKVVGTKQDWETLEHKIHRMRTEVFNQDGTTDQKMSAYLQRAEEQTRKIYTTRDPLFWKNMFGINNCMSGHTDVVEGWIVQFYRKGYARKDKGKIHYTGDDFYNYKAHISTVKWQNVETQRHFELKSGLLYSNVVTGESEDDKKYPWLEPQFSHVIVETDGSGKMTPEAFKKYIEGTLKGRDKTLMQQFYDVLKDDPIELVKGGSEQIDFRFKLVSRQIKAWKEDLLKNGDALTKFDLSEGPCSIALEFYVDVGPQNQPALDTLKEQIIDYMKINTNIKHISLNEKISSIEPVIVDSLIGNSIIEELCVYPTSQESIEKLAQLLLNSNCKLKCLKVNSSRRGYEVDNQDPINFSVLADALVKTNAPIETLVFSSIGSEDLARAVAELCKRPNGLKLLKFELNYQTTPNIEEILFRAQVESKTLQEVSLPGQRRFSDELTQLLVKNLPQNPSLERIARFEHSMIAVDRAKALEIPTLKELHRVDLQELSFLAVTSQLTSITAKLSCSAEQMQMLQNFVSREDCHLETLLVLNSTFRKSAGVTLAKGLVLNKSIKNFSCRMSTFGSVEDARDFMNLIVEWLEKPYCKLEILHLDYMSCTKINENLQKLSSSAGTTLKKETLQRLVKSLTNNTTLKELFVEVDCSEEDIPLFTELVQKNSTLQQITLNSGKNANPTILQSSAPLVEAIRANKSLILFDAYFIEEKKYPAISEDELYC